MDERLNSVSRKQPEGLREKKVVTKEKSGEVESRRGSCKKKSGQKRDGGFSFSQRGKNY